MQHLVVVAMSMFSLTGHGDPACRTTSISWEWYNIAELHQRYPYRKKGDLKIAAHYYELSARTGNAASAYKLGEMFENGTGVGKSYPVALKWYQASANCANKYAEFRVGWFYQYGLGTAKDMDQARLWYERAAGQDNEWAYHMLAFMYADGDSVEQDVNKAREYFEVSLPRTNDNWAKWKLATLIQDSDPKRANQLLKEAAAAGNVEALKLVQKGM